MTESPTSFESISVRLLRGSVFVFVGRLIGIGFGWAINMLLARTLDRADFGRFSFLLTTTVIFSTASRFGFDRILMCHLAELEAGSSQKFVVLLIGNTARVVLVTTLTSAIGMAVFLSAFAPIHESGQASLLIMTAIAIMGVMTVLYLLAECFRGYHDLKRATFYDANRSGPLVCLVFLLLLLAEWAASELTLLQVMLAFFFAQLVILILAAADFTKSHVIRKPPHNDATLTVEQRDETHDLTPAGKISSFQPRSLAWAASSIAASQVIGNFIVFGDTWIAGAVVSATDLGNWSAVAQLMQLVAVPLSMINMTIISAIPALHRQGKLEELQRILQSTATIATIISLIPLTLLICFPAWVIATVYGPQFVDVTLPLAIVSLGRLVFVWTGSCTYTLMLTGKDRIVLVNNVVSALAILSLGYVAALSHGIVGLASVVSGVTILSNVANWLAVRATIGIWTHASLRYVTSWLPASRF